MLWYDVIKVSVLGYFFMVKITKWKKKILCGRNKWRRKERIYLVFTFCFHKHATVFRQKFMKMMPIKFPRFLFHGNVCHVRIFIFHCKMKIKTEIVKHFKQEELNWRLKTNYIFLFTNACKRHEKKKKYWTRMKILKLTLISYMVRIRF